MVSHPHHKQSADSTMSILGVSIDTRVNFVIFLHGKTGAKLAYFCIGQEGSIFQSTYEVSINTHDPEDTANQGIVSLSGIT